MSNTFARLLEEGDKQQAQLQQQPPTESSANEPIASPVHGDSMTARQHAVQTASRHDSMTAQQHDSIHEYVTQFLQAKAQNKTTLRYPNALMSELDEVIYQCKKVYNVSLSKNEIFVLALGYILCDFKRNATRSILFNTRIKDEEK
jgi:hypothetical protein